MNIPCVTLITILLLVSRCDNGDVPVDVGLVEVDINTEVDTEVNTDVDMDINTDVDMDVNTDVDMDVNTDVDMDIDMDVNLNVNTGSGEQSSPNHQQPTNVKWDHNYGRNVPVPQPPPNPVVERSYANRRRCLITPHPGAISPLRQGTTIPYQVRRTVVNVQLYLSQRCSNSKLATAAAVGIPRNTVSKIIREGPRGGSKPTKRRGKKRAVVDEMDKNLIRQIVHEYFLRNEPPTIKKLLVTVKDRLQDRFPYGATFLKKLLRQLKFRYGRQKGPNLHILFERVDIVEWRLSYLRTIRQYRQEKRPIVYLDETWFNCNEAPSRVWQDTTVQENPLLVRPGSGFSLGVRTKSGRGQRLIIVNAIDRSGPVKNALLVFLSNKRRPPEDYHKEMDAHSFEKWFKEKLMPQLNPGTVIVMDNAPYHSRRTVSLPSRGKREDVLKELQKVGFFKFLADIKRPVNPETMKMTEIFALCKEYRSHFNKYAVDEMAKEKGHFILRLPPYHCVFNPIEMLWSYQKNLVRGSSTVRTIQQAQDACEASFKETPENGIGPYFDHVEKEEQKYWRLEGLTEARHQPVIIPLYDSDDDEDNDEDDDLEEEF